VASNLVEQGVVVTIAAGNEGAAGPFFASTGSSGKNVLAIASSVPDVLPGEPYTVTFTDNGVSNTTTFGYLAGYYIFETEGPIKAISLNNKLDESRDLANMVQDSLVSTLRKSNKEVRSRGVKKAPFVVLIGASMPSVLAEISFITNRQELQLVKTAAYKDKIAQALYAAVLRYRKSLKGSGVATIER
jgi:hypothetical protein